MQQKKTIGDPFFGLNPCALAIHALLCQTIIGCPEDFRFKSFPMYNGREKGICLVFGRGYFGPNSLHMFFAENRTSNEIVLFSWIAEEAFNAPSCPSWDEVHGQRFDNGDFQAVADKISTMCQNFVEVEARTIGEMNV